MKTIISLILLFKIHQLKKIIMIDTQTKLKRDRVFDNGFIALENVTFEKEGQEPHTHVRMVKRNAVAGLLFNFKTDKYVFVKQFRTGADAPLIEIVAGTMDVPGESAENCLRREIEEEVGMKCTGCQQICVSYSSPGVSNEQIYIFSATTDGEKIGNGGGVGHEQIEIIEYTADEVLQNWNELTKDMKTCLALLNEPEFQTN